MDDVIVVKNLEKSYKDVKAVKNISFNVKKGSLFAFLGLNGAGKSTTINILCSILKKDRGTIYIDGLDIDKHPDEIKSKIGIVFQKSVLDMELTVQQNLYSRASLYRMPSKAVKERIVYLTEILDLKELLHRPYGKLSGGQKRRIDIARALIHKPQILFLDEPTTGLDPNTRMAVWETLERLLETTDFTIFLTTHYMEEVLKADYAVILDEGRIVAEGTPDVLKEKYATDMLRVILPQTDKVNQLMHREKLRYQYKNGAYLIAVSNAKEAIGLVNKHAKLFVDIEIIKGNMDQVFLNATGKTFKNGDSNEA